MAADNSGIALVHSGIYVSPRHSDCTGASVCSADTGATDCSKCASACTACAADTYKGVHRIGGMFCTIPEKDIDKESDAT